jgi:carbon monoxide dehydrogenase subunit G
MWPIILIIAGAVLVLVLILVALQPPEFTVSRSASAKAPAEAVFALVNNFQQWEAWSPWVKMDPNMTKTYSGPEAGTGAAYAWEGNSKVGKGSMTIVESRGRESIRIRLDFEKPMKASHIAEFTFKPEGGQTVVTWKMSGKSNFAGKAIHLFFNFDKMVGGQFEQGLAAMKALAETPARKL